MVRVSPSFLPVVAANATALSFESINRHAVILSPDDVPVGAKDLGISSHPRAAAHRGRPEARMRLTSSNK